MNLSSVPCQADTDKYLKLVVNDYLQVVTNNVDYGDLMVFHSEGKVINRAELLSPETVPTKITGRVKQMEKLYKCIKPVEKVYTPTSAWLYGPPGTGKTVKMQRGLLRKR